MHSLNGINSAFDQVVFALKMFIFYPFKVTMLLTLNRFNKLTKKTNKYTMHEDEQKTFFTIALTHFSQCFVNLEHLATLA
jgi:hypothetical protein